MSERIRKRVHEEEQAHKPKLGEDRAPTFGERVQPVLAGGDGVAQLLALQQTVGNRTVANLIQRHESRHLTEFQFWVREKKSGEKMWLDTN
jgi:hypothetical protein